MKKLYILALVSLLIAACAEDIDTNDIREQYIMFNVADNNYLPEPEVDTRTTTASPFEESQQFVPQSSFNNYSINKKQDNVRPIESDLDEELILTTTVEQGIRLPNQKTAATRGGKIVTADLQSTGFGVSEYVNGGAIVSGFDNVTTTFASGTTYHSGKTWESDATSQGYDFYAYYPNTNGNGITITSGGQSITYDMSSVVPGSQPDLVTGKATNAKYSGSNTPVNLTLDHRLAAVVIKTGAGFSGGTISALSIGDASNKIYVKGSVAVADGTWTHDATPANDQAVYSPTMTATSAASTNLYGTYFMMVPQTVTGIPLEITLTDAASTVHTLKTTLSGSWDAGTTTTYTITPAGITSMTVNYPAGWTGASGLVAGPVTSYASGESFGLFAVDKNNKIVISNQAVTASADGASPSLSLNGSTFYSSQYTYYLYYPYQSDLITNTSKYNAGGLAAGQTTSATDADTFFSNVISGWTPATNQNTGSDAAARLKSFKDQDLQVAQLSGTSFSMTHQMGLLAGAIPAQTNADDVITYNGNTYNASATGEKWTRITAKCTSTPWNASTTFTSSANTPYNNGSTLYYIAKPADATIAISATAGTQLYAWSVSGANTTISTKNTYKTFTIATPDYSNAFNKKVWEFSYSGAGKQWVAPVAGTYTIECWGASGGLSPQRGTTSQFNDDSAPGRGGYTSGNISLGTISLYVYVGSQGTSTNNAASTCNAGGWNGGGTSGSVSGAPYCGGGGGGSTDIRISQHSSGSWGYNSSTNAGDASLRTRIMVAAGGGGCGSYYSGGHGGGITGGTNSTHMNYPTQTGATQTSTGSESSAVDYKGFFGYARQTGSTNGNGGGGGGGWWGGSTGYGTGGSGGSSFISGMSGCVAINSSGVQTTGVSTMTINNVSYTFSNPVMYGGGDTSRPANPAEPSNTYGNGYAKITYTP